ncbi:MAG: dTDP-4-dehydrorhamnose 3,5-epimerase [Myxococcales bacterium]|nr:dTDP-4-dehydrorhamnose 3,5-epimerase [Myxococcales bacterium]
MKVEPTALAGVLVLERAVHADERGWLTELHRVEHLAALGVPPFVQENLSASRRGVVRGLHFQRAMPQGKLITVVHGAIYDVAVDLRPDEPTLGRWVALELTAAAPRSLWIPPGCAHGFQAATDEAVVLYQLTAPYAAADEGAIRWDDPTLAIPWPIAPAIVSARDRAAPAWRAR